MDYSTINNIFRDVKELQLDYVEIETDKFYLKVKNNQSINKIKCIKPIKREKDITHIDENYESEQKCALTKPSEGIENVKSPIVGMISIYNQNGKAFVVVGQRVEKGDIICIIEAMKMVNEIKSQCRGIVKEILFESDSLVEFGQMLFKIQID